MVIKPKETEKIYSKINLVFLGCGILSLILGYILLGMGPVDGPKSWTLAPILLVIGYVIFIPLALIFKINKNPDNSAALHPSAVSSSSPPKGDRPR